MSYNDAGRIHKEAYLISAATLWTVCLIGAFIRLYIRIRIQKHLSIDDGFFLFGVCCLTSAIGVQFTIFDEMYLAEELILKSFTNITLTPSLIEETFQYHKMVWVVLLLSWSAIVSVKFSYLFLFKELIKRIRPLVIYWWIVLLFNIALTGYGAASYILPCPTLGIISDLRCTNGAGATRTTHYSVSAMALDIASDLFILYIPVHLIWKIKVRWTQKAVLSLSLCLTIFMIVVTIIRISGIRVGQDVDSVWETYWNLISAEVGLVMASATAFRSIFVARANERAERAQQERLKWYHKKRGQVARVFTFNYWKSTSADQSGGEKLPRIPRGTMTGLRTFINGGRGMSITDPEAGNCESADGIYEHTKDTNISVIKVQSDITSSSQTVSSDE